MEAVARYASVVEGLLLRFSVCGYSGSDDPVTVRSFLGRCGAF